MSSVKNQISEDFSARLKLALEERGLSQSQLGAEAGVSKATVSKWMRGTLPRAGELYRLAKTLSVSMDWLFGASASAPISQQEADTVPLGQLPSDKFKRALEDAGISLPGLEQYLDASVEAALRRRDLSIVLDISNPLAETVGGMNKSLLPPLLRLVRNLAKRRGMQSRLASAVGVSRQAVSQWLAGTAMPSGETTLRLRDWAIAEEAKQKSPGGVSAPPEPRPKDERKYDKSKSSEPPKGWQKQPKKSSGK